jgi:hypothetical protein
MVRAKLRLSRVTDQGQGKLLRFDAQYDDTIPEDQRFQKATPSGHVELVVDNPAAIDQFKQGETYYVDFTPA